MIPEKDLKISLEELSLRGEKILARQPATTYAEALAQVQRLKEISKVNGDVKRSR